MPGKIVWAYNADHLAYIAEFISADLRERNAVGNGSLCSRLPDWMKSARNRVKVLKAIRRIEARRVRVRASSNGVGE